MKRSYSNLKKAIENAGFKFFEGHYNLNFIGVRSNNKITNEWDDNFYCVFQTKNGRDDKGEVIWENHVLHIKDFTTDPGEHYSKHKLLNEKGVAILARGQHRGMWKIGKHRGKYTAFVQASSCLVYRDGNKDETMDFEVEHKGHFGINMHHGYNSEEVGRHSAGCQVFKHVRDLEKVIKLYREAQGYNGLTVSYTLLDKADFDFLKKKRA